MTVPEELDDLAREAATWFARMRGPDAGARQGAFEAWLARGPEHLAAYNRAGEVFALGKLLADEPAAAPRPKSRRWLAPLATATACLAAAGIWFGTRDHIQVQPSIAAAGAPARLLLVTEPGETRLARLEDGSRARLASDSRLAIAFGATRRVLALEKGSARFDVHHETRPFVVLAGGGSVTARGTLFDVSLVRPGQVEVRLIRGVIDVQLPHPRPDRSAPIRRLVAGESLAFVVPPRPVGVTLRPPPAPATPTPPDPGAGAGARDFVAVPVATLVAAANRAAARPIRLADNDLGTERVSGRLRIDDTQRLARNLSGLFGWSVDLHDPKEIVLRR